MPESCWPKRNEPSGNFCGFSVSFVSVLVRTYVSAYLEVRGPLSGVSSHLYIMWVPEIKLRLSGLVGSGFIS